MRRPQQASCHLFACRVNKFNRMRKQSALIPSEVDMAIIHIDFDQFDFEEISHVHFRALALFFLPKTTRCYIVGDVRLWFQLNVVAVYRCLI